MRLFLIVGVGLVAPLSRYCRVMLLVLWRRRRERLERRRDERNGIGNLYTRFGNGILMTSKMPS